MFRIENSRTEIQQLSYIRKNALLTTFFDDPESVGAQSAQEQILIDMVKSKGKNMLEDLRNKGQDDPCIITYDGYIVNGNRRTAGLKFIGTRYIECVVLKEDATPKDIYSLEQQLQISQDFREAYHWINELRNIRRGLEDQRYKFSEIDLAANLNLEVKDLKIKLTTLDLIDAFLIWKKIPKQYDYQQLYDAEEIFRQLEKGIKKYSKDSQKRESLQNSVFILIESKPPQGRLYKYVTDLIKNFDQIYVKMGAEQNESISDKIDDEGDNSLLSDLQFEQTRVQPIFEDSSQSNDLSSQIVDALKDIDAENKEKQDAEAVYESVSSALRELQGLTIDSDTVKLSSINKKLEQIIITSSLLLKKIQSINN
jgi:hypothetical protein